MKPREGILFRDCLGQAVLLDNSGRIDGVIKLNETAAFVWKQLEEGKNPDEIARLIAEEFEVEEAIALSDVNELIKDFSEKGLLQ